MKESVKKEKARHALLQKRYKELLRKTQELFSVCFCKFERKIGGKWCCANVHHMEERISCVEESVSASFG